MSSFTDRQGARIVIVGGGFGGAYCAQALERLLGADEAELVLLDRNNYFVFYPLLIEAGTGSVEPRHAVVAIRAFLGRTRFVMGEVEGLDLEAREVRYRLDGVGGPGQGQTLGYDHLILAPGSVTMLPAVEGLREHGREMKSLADAVALRDHAVRQLELADLVATAEERRRLLCFVVVGANFTGVEVAGELDVFLRRARRRYGNIAPDDIRVTLVELGQRILPALEEELSEYALDQLARRGVQVELGCSVCSVAQDHAVLSNGRTLPTETVIWCAGIAPSPLIERLPLPTDERGYILCEPDLAVRGLERVWAIGDSAVNTSPEGDAYPATAQHAVQQGRHLARNLARVLRGQPTEPCIIRSKGALAALGCRTGVAKVLGIRVSGFAAWFLWRTVYLMKMPQWSRRLRVALDWTVDLLFPKDVVQLGLARSGRERGGRGKELG